MTTYEEMKDWPTTNVTNARGNGWVKSLPVPDPFVWRVRDAWEILQGRAIAVRQTTAEEAEQRADGTRRLI